MSLIFIIILLSCFPFYLFSIASSSSEYARRIDGGGGALSSTTTTSQDERAKLLIKSLSSSKIHDKNNTFADRKRQFSFFTATNPSVAYLSSSSGYYSLPRNNDAKMFFYFFKSRMNRTNDPVLISLNGVPGLSCNIAVYNENGPFRIIDNTLVWNRDGWDTISNIIYVEQPMGTGYSFIDNEHNVRHNQIDVVNDLYDFLQIFFANHPDYVKNDFYITGQSFGGHYAPILANKILIQNNSGRKVIQINLKGIAIGNALTDLALQYSRIPYYARDNGLITEEEYLNIKKLIPICEWYTRACGPGNEGKCLEAFSSCYDIFQATIQSINSTINYYNIAVHRVGRMSNYDYTEMQAILNNSLVKNSLGVPDKEFRYFSSGVYEALKGEWAKNTQIDISILLDNQIKVLNYAGGNDLVWNKIGTKMTTMNVPWSSRETFRLEDLLPFYVDNVQVGVKRTHHPFTYLEIFHAGHIVPMDKPRVAVEMIRRWMQGEF